MTPGLDIARAIRIAVASGRPVVGLETAVLTHGLPKPRGLETLRRMRAAVEEAGARPAIVGVVAGRLVVGLDDADLAALSAAASPAKLAARDLAWALASGATGGTTVSATLLACRLAGIHVLATGGIGGVHRGWTARPDVSGDLLELARSRCAVVACGAKAVLDVAATVEALEALAIPVLGLRTDAFPELFARGVLRAVRRVESVEAAAAACARHWGDLAQPGGALVAQDPPVEAALPRDEVERAVAAAHEALRPRATAHADVTPELLAEVARVTHGRSVDANEALLVANARTGAELAVALAALAR